jgi:hypothetical protein
MVWIALYLVLQVPTESKILVDANIDYVTTHEIVRERFGAYYGGSIALDTDESKAYIFTHRWKAEIIAQDIRDALSHKNYSYWVRVIDANQVVPTYYERQSEFISEKL